MKLGQFLVAATDVRIGRGFGEGAALLLALTVIVEVLVAHPRPGPHTSGCSEA